MRRLSYTEISTAQTCQARWDFSYGGRLAGDALEARHVLPILRDGRAWGAGVAAYHAGAGNLLGQFDAITAIKASIDEDLKHMQDAGVMTDAALDDRNHALTRLEAMLAHYLELTDRFAPIVNLTRLEDEIDIPVPSRTGMRSSTRYRYCARIDGFTVDDHDDEWLVEFKLRKRLQPRWVIELLRQYRWYAWARQRESDRKVVGIIVDERLNEVPKPPRILKDKSVSTDKRQLTTTKLYMQACAEVGQDVDPEFVMELNARQWQQRVPILFRPGELEEAGRELTSAGIDIRDLDAGTKFPTRNASERTCGGCRFRRICNDPHGQLVDELFMRVPPKRLRDVVEQSQPQPKEVAA